MRFTRDGSDALEGRLAEACREIGAAVRGIVPGGRLQALVLGGGYGRGEGGVLATAGGDAPYNDLEFFLLAAGHPRRNERRFGAALHALGHRMTERLGIEVEFKVLSLETLRSAPTTMFYHDLVCGHHVVEGPPEILESCRHHADAGRIPLHEATRLLMNRCSGLLFAAERLRRAVFSADDADFTARNIAKARLAIGDAILAAEGRYHWSCLVRHERLAAMTSSRPPAMESIVAAHREGVSFKLHPVRSSAGREALASEHAAVASLAWPVWQWLEERRIGVPLSSPLAYGRNGIGKCRETGALKNAAIRLRTFGVRGVASRQLFRYPREALLNTLPLLLWAPDAAAADAAWLSRQFVRPVSGRDDAVAAYARLWERFN
jgi:hypothetical protein